MRLVDPHQGRLNNKSRLHAEVQNRLKGFNCIVSAVGIARVVRLAHSADEMTKAAPIGERCGEREKNDVATWHERIGQAAYPQFYRDITSEGGVRDFPKGAKVDCVILTEFERPTPD